MSRLVRTLGRAPSPSWKNSRAQIDPTTTLFRIYDFFHSVNMSPSVVVLKKHVIQYTQVQQVDSLATKHAGINNYVERG